MGVFRVHHVIIICRVCRRDQPFVAPSVAELSLAIRRAGWLEAIGPDADWAAGGYCPEHRESVGERKAA